MAFNWEIKSTFDSTLTDRPAVKVKVALPHFKALHGNASKTPGHYLPSGLFCSCTRRGSRATLTFTAGLSVSVLLNVDVIK